MALTTFTPDGVLKILKGVGLDPAYTDTYHFVSKTQQQTFFEGKVYWTNLEFTPVRENQAIRVAANSQQLFDCDYIMYQNTNYNNKWFYAFITSIDWVNINTCLISYEIDVVQTWYFDFIFPQMFVEREHVNNDAVGENLIDEGLETGEWIIRSMTPEPHLANIEWEYQVWATIDDTGANSVGTMYGGIYSGLTRSSFPTASALRTWINTQVSAGKGDAIIAITMVPSNFKATDQYTPKFYEYSFTPPLPTASGKPNLDGYVPHNNKLYTYPYNFLKVSNHQGNAGVFRYEFFNWGQSNKTCRFTITMDETPNPTALLAPQFYKGTIIFPGDMDEQLTLNSFPLCAWASDTFKAWLAQNSNSLQWQESSILINSTVGAVEAMATGNFMGGINSALSGYNNMRSLMATKQDKSILPPQAHGANSGYIQAALKQQNFFFYEMTITAEYAKAIDGYFDMYGYAVHKVKSPNFTGRLSWNYVKTQTAHVLGSAPAPASRKMEEILNNGIRFWHGDWMGDFGRDNRIVTSIPNQTESSYIDLAGQPVTAHQAKIKAFPER